MMSRVMSYNRFHLIDKFLHFVDNKSLDENYEKIAKIKPIYQYLFERFRTLYIPERDISIDESLLLWKGRLSWKQYIPNKRARFGLKSFVLCESSTGYIWNGKLYTGKELTADLDRNYGQFHYMGTKIIVDLMSDALLDKGYRLHIDNWYTSFEVVKHLLDHKTNCIGTLRKDRKGIPKDVVGPKKIKANERIVRYEERTGIMCTRWKDKKDVYMMSSCITNDTVNVMRAGKPKDIPLVVHMYNQSMGGVDRSDQMLTTYEAERKRIKKWYKIFFLCTLLVVLHSMLTLSAKSWVIIAHH